VQIRADYLAHDRLRDSFHCVRAGRTVVREALPNPGEPVMLADTR
jgi:hypothetical protein